MRFGSTVGLRMVGRDGSVIETETGLQLIDDSVDKFCTVVRLDDFGKTKVNEDFVETRGDGERSLVGESAQQRETSGDVSDDKKEIFPIDRGRKRTGKVDGQVIERKAGMDRIQRMKSLSGDIELLTGLALSSVSATVLEQRRPVITFGPYLLEESIRA